jgi:hypothetical protein
LPKSKNDLSLRELLLHPELLSECPILSKKLHPEWTKIRGSGQEELFQFFSVKSEWNLLDSFYSFKGFTQFSLHSYFMDTHLTTPTMDLSDERYFFLPSGGPGSISFMCCQ